MVGKARGALPPHAAAHYAADETGIFDQLENCQHTLPGYIAISSETSATLIHRVPPEEMNSEALCGIQRLLPSFLVSRGKNITAGSFIFSCFQPQRFMALMISRFRKSTCRFSSSGKRAAAPTGGIPCRDYWQFHLRSATTRKYRVRFSHHFSGVSGILQFLCVGLLQHA